MPPRRALLSLLLCGAAACAHAQESDFLACLAELRRGAASQGISEATFDSALASVEPEPSVLEAMETQPEFATPIWEYLAVLVDDKRVAEGRRKLAAWSDVLERVEREYGVDRHVVVAVWGVESNFGRNIGRRPLLRSLATTSCYGRRQPYFRGELFETLRIVQAGDMPAEALRGSWAGAFGQTQFMPSTFQRVAVDFDGDGKRDIVSSIPDALASTANYLRDAGWESGRPWGLEVRVPKRYDGPSGRRTRMPLHEWNALGIRGVGRKRLSGDTPAALILPGGIHGPAFVVFRNFDAIFSYNASISYALAIAHLSDRLRGGGDFRVAWAKDDPLLSRTERMELQERLNALGLDAGEVDGIVGGRTIEAIKAFQRSAGLPPDGYPGARLLQALRERP